ncbi:MAG: murein biosynthesis integral membrane protein MurJ [Notoacmeibacter sp.]|nr:murein biosynthesis integral membrane protein MurJ [Notoacmeibacter sp.]MCC0032407.1 murein biosynthesis integral membrane protein MurJ [Brucellaceae bacterium]
MSLVGKFASVGGATMASRVLGFVREALIGAALGAGPVADAFYAAFGFPNLFRRLFAEGAFNSAFVPLFAKEVEGGGLERARRFAEQVLAMLSAVLIGLSALAMIFMPGLVATVVAPLFADTPGKFAMTVDMTRIMFPYLFCMSLVAMFSGILNSLRHYFLAAIVPVLLNVIMVGVTALALWSGVEARETGYWLAWGVFASGFVQLALLVWGAARQGMTLRPGLPRMTPEVKRLMILMAPAMVTGGVTQINIMIGRIIASAQDGAIAILNYADRINQLPLGVIGIAIGVVLLPELSRALRAGDDADAQHLQNRSLEFALALTLPAAIGFMVLPGPLVNLLYERGAFSPQTTLLTAQALAAFAAGLPAYVLVKVFQPAYFAREDMKTPLWFSIVSVAVNIVLSLLLFPLLGHVAIAAATAISAWVNVVLLALVLWRRGEFRPSPATRHRLAMIVLAGLAMGAAVLLVTWAWPAPFADPSFMIRLAAVLGVILLAAIVYFGLVIATGGLDRDELKRAMRRRRRAA